MLAHLWGDNVMSRVPFRVGKHQCLGCGCCCVRCREGCNAALGGCRYMSVLLGCDLEGTRSPVDIRGQQEVVSATLEVAGICGGAKLDLKITSQAAVALASFSGLCKAECLQKILHRS